MPILLAMKRILLSVTTLICLFTFSLPATASTNLPAAVPAAPIYDVSITGSVSVNKDTVKITYVSKNVGNTPSSLQGVLIALFIPPELSSMILASSDKGSFACTLNGRAKGAYSADFRALPWAYDDYYYWGCGNVFDPAYNFAPGDTITSTVMFRASTSFNSREIIGGGFYGDTETDYNATINNSKAAGDVRKAGTNNLSLLTANVTMPTSATTPVTTPKNSSGTNKKNAATTTPEVTVLGNVTNSEKEAIKDFTKGVIKKQTKDAVKADPIKAQTADTTRFGAVTWAKDNSLKVFLGALLAAFLGIGFWFTKEKISSSRRGNHTF